MIVRHAPATTANIQVSVETEFADAANNFFAYRITIENKGFDTVQLLRRHWYITDADGSKREVEGEGVVGEQPVLKPGTLFAYTSGCNFTGELGSMSGTYLMQRANDGTLFEVAIPLFTIVCPAKLN